MEIQGLVFSEKKLHLLLQGCIQRKDLACGRQIHSLMIYNGLYKSAFLGDYLIRLFALCGKVLEANVVFKNVLQPTAYTWNALISAHGHLEQAKRALELFFEMENEGIKADQATFLCILKACNGRMDQEVAQVVHSQITQTGLELDVFLGSTLIDIYAKAGNFDEALKTFSSLPSRNVVSWGALIAGCSQLGHGKFTFELFERMQLDGTVPGRVVYLGVLKACGHLKALEEGRKVHHLIIRGGLQLDKSIQNCLVDMYAKCRGLDEARVVFDQIPDRDVVSWSVMLGGYVENGLDSCALELFDEIKQEGIQPDKVMVLWMLRACANAGSIEKGSMIHNHIKRSGLEIDMNIGNSLIDMYAKCRAIDNARAVFDEMPARYHGSWAAMIAGYVEYGSSVSALELFADMQHHDLEPNGVVFLCVIKACSSIGAVRQGRELHDKIFQNNFESDIVIENAIIDLYVKCGSLDEANNVFQRMPRRDVVSWGAMITGCAHHGYCRLAGEYLEKMIQEGLQPDSLIFATLLMACSHSGLLEEGCYFFRFMHEKSSIVPSIAHVNCMADLLCRTGQLKEAKGFLQSFPVSPGMAGWISLLTSCGTYGQINLGKHSFEEAVQLDPSYASSYALLSSVYVDVCVQELVSVT